MSVKEKKIFVKLFQEFDRLFAQLQSFTKYDESMLENYGITMEEYDDYAGVIKSTIDFTGYKAAQEKALPKFKYYAKCMEELKKTLDEEIKPLLSIF